MSGLAIEDLHTSRAGALVLRGCDVEVPAGQVTVLLGANGAGKTTLLETVSGVIPADRGRILLDGEDVARTSRRRRARLGVAHVEQGRTVFRHLTVAENLRAAGHGAHAIAATLEIFPELEPRIGTRAGDLSGGEQQMVVLARALAAEPRVLLVDEMSLGLAPIVVQRLLPIVRDAADRGIAVLLVEQFAPLALSIGDRAYVLSRGAVVTRAAASTLADQADVLRGAYLGETTVA
jgi:branched-chain amino acid transport system ATP-binding protein